MSRYHKKNIKISLAYDGTHYCGWQDNENYPSIAGSVTKVLEQILQEEITLQGASRTDAGVHANGQVANFLTSKESLDLNKLMNSINRLLPKDIAMLNISFMPLSFHPTLDCSIKEYHYYLCNGKIQHPHDRHYSWHYPFSLNLEKIKNAIPHLIGKYDFASFCNHKTKDVYHNTIREIYNIEVTAENEKIIFKVQGKSFLYKMVRNIVGSLAYVGSGKISAENIPAILDCKDRCTAGITAPAHGLHLHKIYY